MTNTDTRTMDKDLTGTLRENLSGLAWNKR